MSTEKRWLELAPELEQVASRIYGRGWTGICPAGQDVFRAFQYFNPADTRVVILGQDPYHHYENGKWKAWGLSFGYNPQWEGSVNSSLENVLAEVGVESEEFDTSLEPWAKQGVLLLNTRLTCEAHKPMSHAGMGWEQPVTEILKWLYQNTKCVFLLWGAEARNTFSNAVNEPASETERVLITSHPCKYSAHRGFRGCDHFRGANQYLREQGMGEIKWT